MKGPVQLIKQYHPRNIKVWVKITSVLFISLYVLNSGAQQGISLSDPETEKVTAKELTIPASPVFDLMGVTPAHVARMSDIKDFKVDWSFKSWRLNPNLALQGQPVWEIFYNRKDLSKYQKASPLMRSLSTLDLSFGTVQNEDNDRRIGVAAKINVWKERDPLLNRKLYADTEKQFKEEKMELETTLSELKKSLATTQDVLQKPALRQQMESVEEELLTLNSRRQAEINRRARIYAAEHWNASSLDIAIGKIYTYETDEEGGLRSLRLNRNTAAGMWLNGGWGLGRKGLVSGLIRASFYEELLRFQVLHNLSGEITDAEAVAKNTLFTAGVNLRYGNAAYTFFAEFIHERKGLNTALEALADAYTPPEDITIVAQSVKWNIVQPYTFNMGGDWRMSRNVILNYGIRWLMDKKLKTTTFIPLVNIACMMR